MDYESTCQLKRYLKSCFPPLLSLVVNYISLIKKPDRPRFAQGMLLTMCDLGRKSESVFLSVIQIQMKLLIGVGGKLSEYLPLNSNFE